jgi:hypothetical protein
MGPVMKMITVTLVILGDSVFHSGIPDTSLIG